MRDLYYLDTETVGLMGPAVLIQYSRPGSRDVVLHHVWEHTPRETMDLIERIMLVGYVGFNTVYDHYHLQKLYCMLWALGPQWYDRPMRDVSPAKFASMERRAVFGPCVKAREIVDLYSYARKHGYQKFMARESAWMFNVPEIMAQDVARELNSRLDSLDPFYFSALKDELTGWTVEEKKQSDPCDPGFRHLQLRFKSKLTLKAIYEREFGTAKPGLPIPREIMPWDRQKKPAKSSKISWTWMPYAEGCTIDGLKRERMWPEVVEEHVKFWLETETTYAEDDITMLHELDERWGYPASSDDCTLTGVVASVRYRGYPVNLPAIRADLATCREIAQSVEAHLGCSLDQHVAVKKRLIEECGDDELMSSAVTGSNDQVLTALERLKEDDGTPHPVAKLATRVKEGRTAKKKANWLTKIITAGRFHPSYNVVGTNTNRMSGADSLNPQGIDASYATRSMFTMQDRFPEILQYLAEYDPYWLPKIMGRRDPEAEQQAWFIQQMRHEYETHGDFSLCGGDFDGFETAIAVAVWDEQRLGELVLQGIKAYHVFGSYLYAEVLPQIARQRFVKARQRHHERTMPRLKARKLAAKEGAAYKRDALYLIQRKKFKDSHAGPAKNCWYALVYGAQEKKIADTAGLTMEQVEGAYRRMGIELPDMATARQKVFAVLTALTITPEGKFVLVDHGNEQIKNLQGLVRDFSREREVIAMLFDFFNNIPRRWREVKGELIRNEKKGPQSLFGCIISAAIGGAMRVQARMQRQGTNFQMQSAGAMICKQCQAATWDLQPAGCSPWLVIPMNIHDEIVAAIRKTLSVLDRVYEVVEQWRPRIPLIQIEWKEDIASWADK